MKGFFGKKVIIKVAGGGEKGDISAIKGRKLGTLYLRLMKRADRIISVSKEITSQLGENSFPPSLIKEIPNGVDTSVFNLLEGPMSHQERWIIYVGRFDRAKALGDLFRAFKKVHVRFSKARLVLVGDGDEKESLIRLAHELDISPFVRFEGIQEDVKSYLSQSEIFAFPSLSEGMSNVLLEAMACGLPVVATRIGGNVDLIENGLNGLLVSPGEPEELSEAIITLLAVPERSRQMGKNGRRRVEERFSLDRIAEEYIKLYQELGQGV
jgi:glycosyltransferase involved in cell wall biosynthesis